MAGEDTCGGLQAGTVAGGRRERRGKRHVRMQMPGWRREDWEERERKLIREYERESKKEPVTAFC